MKKGVRIILGNISVAADDLMNLVTRAFVAAGVNDNNSRNASRILVEAEMMGLGTHGVRRVLNYTERLRSGGMNPKAKIAVDRRTPSLALIDGDNGLGPAVGSVALHTALEMVAESGIAYVGCKASNHFGALAPYCIQSCEAGYVMFSGTNASMTMAPFGGKEARIGNNPFCVAAPIPDGVHFILDMAISVAARAKIRNAEEEGTPIPEGWAVDKEGLPTTDPVEALAGFLLPLGGHKGSGMSMVVDLLAGLLTGGKFLTGIQSWSESPEVPSGVGHFFILIDPARLIGREKFNAAMLEFSAVIQSTPAASSSSPVMLPGQREQQYRAESIKNGISISSKLLNQIADLAGMSRPIYREES